MHDTSTESQSKWRTVGSKRSESIILSSGLTTELNKESRKYLPSKQREISSSRIFNKNRSKIQSLDNIGKDDLNDSRSKEAVSFRPKKESNVQLRQKPILRLNSILQEYEIKEPLESPKNSRDYKSSNIISKAKNVIKERELMALKEDYNKFKQKILAELQMQKHSITQFVSSILQSVKCQLLAIEQKYANSSNSLKKQHSMPTFPSLNLELFLPKLKQNEIQTIKTPNPMPVNSSQKALIAQLTSSKNSQDLITQRFSRFYSTIEKLKSDLDCLHQISSISHQKQNPTLSQINQTANRNGLIGNNRETLKFLIT